MVRSILSALVGTLLLASFAQAATVQRTFVSAAYGNDANKSTGCAVTAPCRWLYTAVATDVLKPNGEVVILDNGPYGAVTITQPLSITAPPGVYGGISVFAGNIGVTVNNASGGSVILRGLTINGQGGDYGVRMVAGSKLVIENCLIANFQTAYGTGVEVTNAAEVRVVNSIIRDNRYGLDIGGGATATVSGSVIAGNTNGTSYGSGIVVRGNVSGITTAHVADTVLTGNYWGVTAYSDTSGATAKAFLTGVTVTNNDTGVDSDNSGGTAALVTINNSMVTQNGTGLRISGAGAVMTSFGTNVVAGNSMDVSGSTTPAALQ